MGGELVETAPIATAGGTIDVTAGAGSAADAALADLVGKTGLGDIDISADGSELFVANLYQQRFYRLSLPDGQVLGSFLHGATREPWHAHARPFGLGWFDGWLYHGVVNTRETDDAPLPFMAEIYRTRPDGGDMEHVLTIGLPYGRRVAWAPWRPDSDGRTNDSPILADIDFRPSGAPIFGLRDRQADMNPDCVWDPTCAGGPSVGDLLPSIPFIGGGWTIVRTPPWYRDTGPDEYDLTWGAIAQLPGMDITVAPARSGDGAAAETANRLNAYWFDNESGARLRGESLVVAPAPPAVSNPPYIRLAAGDIEVLCEALGELDPSLGPTATIEAAAHATATALEAGRRRGTDRAVRETAHVPTAIARATAVAGTATSLAPTLVVAAPTFTAAAAVRSATEMAVAPLLTALAPTAAAVATDAAREVQRPPGTATAAAETYQTIKFTCGGHNPYLVTTCFTPALDGVGRAYSSRWRAGQGAVVAFNDTADEDLSKHFSLAYQPDVGAVFGVAHDLKRDQVYVAAYVKRLSELGPLGTGGIYQIDLPTGVVRPWASLAAGVDPHEMTSDFDKRAASAVGRVGLGDIEIAADDTELYVVNLYDQLIYRLSVPDGVVRGAFPHGGIGESWAQDAAPFALAVRDGWLYHGVTDTRAGDEDGEREFLAYVYRSRGDGSAMTKVARLALDYARAPLWQPWAARHDEGKETIYAGANVTFGKSSGLGDVEALCAALTPTPSPTSTSTATWTPAPSPSPSATPTHSLWTIYLPVSVWHPCIRENYYSDVVLVLDISTSMDRLTRAKRTKLRASLDQAKRFVNQMSFVPDANGGHDQVAVVGFNRKAWIQQPLTKDQPAILAAIDKLPEGREEYTRLDLALKVGVEALHGPTRIRQNTKVIILLTDGLPNQVPYAEDGTMETTVLHEATAAKVDGIRVYTIGIGAPDDISPELLQAVATHANLYYYEPDPEDLGRVYSEIVGTFGCPRSRFEWDGAWPGSP